MVVRKRILVIDDDEIVRRSCARALGERGYEVETASSGTEGLRRSSRGYFDCALVDLRMPDVDGMEIVRIVRRSRKNMAVVIITGHGAVATAAEATRLGVSDYISKPFTPDQLVQSIEQALTESPDLAAFTALARAAEGIEASVPKAADYEHRSPQTVAEMVTGAVSVKKATVSILNIVILGILAGAYIGFGAALATLAGHDAAGRLGVGVASILAGSAFSVGLILVVVAGAELFTGNSLMIAGVLGRQYGLGRLLGRWGVVYVANFAGALLVVLIMYQSGLWKTASGAVGAKAVAIAGAKTSLSFGEAFFRGVGCNWLVCLAVWMALAAKDIAGKVLVIFFPIMAFVALGYEHCVANMYFIPMGLVLRAGGATGGAELASLTWGNFFTANLVPVTLGNIVGGAIFVGSAYWCAFMRGTR